MDRCIVYTVSRLLLFICPYISSFFFLSNFQTFKIFVTLFSETVWPIRLKLGTHMNSEQMYRVYRNQAAAIYSSLYFSFFFLSNFQTLNCFVTLLRNCEALKVETWYTRGQWADVLCVPESGCWCLFVPLFLHFSFSTIFKQYKFSSHFSQQLWGIEDWNMVHTWSVGRCIVFTGIRLLVLIRPFILSFFFLSNFQTLKFFVTLFSETVWPRRLKFGTHVQWADVSCLPESGWCCLFIPLFFIFLSLQFSNINIFVTLFSGTERPKRLKLGTHVDSGHMYCVYCIQAAAVYLSLYFFVFFFSPIFKHLNFSSHFSQKLCGLEEWNLAHTWTVSRCIVYTGISLLLLTHPFIFIFLSLQFSKLTFFVTLFSGTVRPWRLKLGTHVDSGPIYCVYRNQAAAAYLSLCFFIFLSLNFHFFCFSNFQFMICLSPQIAL